VRRHRLFGIGDLPADDVLDGLQLEALLLVGRERVIEVRPDRARGLRVRERVAAAAVADEQRLAGRRVAGRDASDRAAAGRAESGRDEEDREERSAEGQDG
jgi:hypothetical protein